jgi:hypothetical protein
VLVSTPFSLVVDLVCLSETRLYDSIEVLSNLDHPERKGIFFYVSDDQNPENSGELAQKLP